MKHFGVFKKEEQGFSLTELLVVIVIIGILALIAIPKFMNVTTKAKMTEAKQMLKTLYTLQEAYYLENDVYTENLGAIGFDQVKLISEGGSGRYLIAIEKADGVSFTAIATAVVDFDKDGTFNVWEVNEDGKIKQRVAD